jgi:pimeloyl-ACP methyl ester carboxylesterase
MHTAHEPVPIVLVHGALHGPWCWEVVVPPLAAAGHAVIAVDLPGRDPASDPAQISLASYTAAVLEALKAAPAPALLVGHSLGGLSISTAAEARPERVRELVYLCAAVPKDGQALSAGAANEAVAAQVRSDDNGRSFYFSPEYARGAFYGDCTPHHAEHGLQRLVRQPLRPLREPVQLSAARFGSIPKHYILTRQDTMIPPAQQTAFAIPRRGADARTGLRAFALLCASSGTGGAAALHRRRRTGAHEVCAALSLSERVSGSFARCRC